MDITTVQPLLFDYTQLEPAHRNPVSQAAAEIKSAGARVQSDLLYIGQKLIAVKELLDHGMFQRWIDEEFSWSYRTAANMMAVTRRFAGKSATVSLLNDSTLYMLAAPSVPAEAIEQVAQEARQNGKAPTKERVKRIIAQPQPAQTALTPEPVQTIVEAMPRAKRSLTAEETEAVIKQVMARHAGDQRKDQASWLALHYSPSNFEEALNGENVSFERGAFSEAYRRVQIEVGNVRGPAQPAPMASPEPVEGEIVMTPHEQKQALIRFELEGWREARRRIEQIGDLTGNYSVGLGLGREIDKAIALLKGNLTE